jgi:hypothetical protein
MTVAVALTVDGATEAQYDELHASIASSTPEGLVLHTMGSVGTSLMIFDIWQDEAAFERFSDDVMVPAMRRIAPGARPDVKTWPLHNVWQADASELARMGTDPMPSKAMA